MTNHMVPTHERKPLRSNEPDPTRRPLLYPARGEIRFDLTGFILRERPQYTKLQKGKRSVNRRQLQLATHVSMEFLHYALNYPETLRLVGFRTLAKLCEYLGCQPGDLMVWVPFTDLDSPLSEQYQRGLTVEPAE